MSASSQHLHLRPGSNDMTGIKVASTETNYKVPKWEFSPLLKGEPWAANSLSLTGEIFTSAKCGKAAEGRRVEWLAAVCLSEDRGPELLLLCMEAISYLQELSRKESVKYLTPAVTPGSHHVLQALCIIPLHITINCNSMRDISAFCVAVACTVLLQALKKQPFALKKVASLVNCDLALALSTAQSYKAVR